MAVWGRLFVMGSLLAFTGCSETEFAGNQGCTDDIELLEPVEVVFVIDNSGSMGATDPFNPAEGGTNRKLAVEGSFDFLLENPAQTGDHRMVVREFTGSNNLSATVNASNQPGFLNGISYLDRGNGATPYQVAVDFIASLPPVTDRRRITVMISDGSPDYLYDEENRDESHAAIMEDVAQWPAKIDLFLYFNNLESYDSLTATLPQLDELVEAMAEKKLTLTDSRAVPKTITDFVEKRVKNCG